MVTFGSSGPRFLMSSIRASLKSIQLTSDSNGTFYYHARTWLLRFVDSDNYLGAQVELLASPDALDC